GHTYAVHARGAGDCLPNATDDKLVNITCLAAPCLTLTLDALAPACAGTAVNDTVMERNSGTAGGPVFLPLDGGAEVPRGSTPAGADMPFSLPAGALVCVGGGHTYAVHARGAGDCLPNATDDKSVNITCLTAPCVTLTLDALAPACAGS